MTGRGYVEKDPGAKDVFGVEWADRLDADEAIIASVWTVPPGITQATPPPSFQAKRTNIWLEGGTDGTVYRLLNKVTTDKGRTPEKTLRVWVKEA